MTVRIHRIELSNDTQKFTRMIVASTSVNALRAALTKLPDDIVGPLRIVCTPLCALVDGHVESLATAAIEKAKATSC